MGKLFRKIIIIIICLILSNCVDYRTIDKWGYHFRLKNKLGQLITDGWLNSNVDVYYYEFKKNIYNEKCCTLPLTLECDSYYNVHVHDINGDCYYKTDIRIKSGDTITFKTSDWYSANCRFK